MGNIQVKKQHYSGYQHDQVNDSGLFKVFLEGFKKAFYNVRFFISDHLQGDVKQSSQGRPDGDDGNTANKADEI